MHLSKQSLSEYISSSDLVQIKISDNTFALAYVIVREELMFLAIDPRLRSQNDYDTVIPSMFTWTEDSQILSGHWKLPIIPPVTSYNMRMPEYHCWVSGVESVVDWRRQYIRDYNLHEDGHLKRMKSRSPSLVERAIRAVNGLDEWLSTFDEMQNP